MTWLEFASIGGGITVVATCIAAVYKVAFFAGKWEEKEKVVDAIKKELSNIQKSIFRLEVAVQMLSQKEGGGTEESNSPVRLSKAGRDIAEKINAEKIIEDRLERLSAEHFSILDIKLDIEEKAREVSRDIYEELDEKTQRIAKDALYEHGFPITQIYSVLALTLRDKIIQQKENKVHTKASV